MRSEDVQRFEGALSRYDEEKTVAIFVASSASRSLCIRRYRKDIFTSYAKDRARSSEYIILTDELNMYSDLINFIESHPLKNSSNNNFLFHFYHIVIILFLVLIWLSLNQNEEDVTNYIY